MDQIWADVARLEAGKILGDWSRRSHGLWV